MQKVTIYGECELGSVNKAIITREGAINIIAHNHPFLGNQKIMLPFRSYFKNDAGSNIMAVDGGTTEVGFHISANEEFDIFIKYISAEIGDTGAINLNKFGNLGALTNGVTWTWFTNEEGSYILHEGIKTNKAFIRIAGDTGAIGTGANAYLADVSGGTEKSYLPNIDIAETFGMTYGLRLRAGSKDRLSFTVRDPLQTLSTFDIIGHGSRIRA